MAEGAGAEPETCICEMWRRWPICVWLMPPRKSMVGICCPRGQLAPVRGDGGHREHVLQPRVLLPEGVGQALTAGWPASGALPPGGTESGRSVTF